jgi:prolyl-tRNA editing enzyme YbaK/EbsC (Cys-tRNA(Pro) deacylase)
VTFVLSPTAASGEATRLVDLEDAVRTEVLVTRLGWALCVVPEAAQLDVALAREALRDPTARPATSEELARSFPHYEPGSLPPLGLLFVAPMYVDPAVLSRRSLVFRAGRADVTVTMSSRALLRDEPMVVTPLAVSAATDAS